MKQDYLVERVFINLIRSIINDKKPSALPDGISADDIFAIGSRQDMAPITFCALNMLSPKQASEKWNEYQKHFMDDCMRSELQMSEYRKLVNYLCENGVKVLPLKGCVIKELYPSPNFRSMCDVDLLYAGVTPKELSKLMEQLGYSTERLESGCHEVFHKKPCMNIEPHRKLIKDDSPYKPVLENMFDKAVSDEKIPNLYHMKPEDLYIHVIAHAAHHFKISGLGARPLLDFYILNQTFSSDWDRAYIDKQLASVGLEKFEKKMREVAYDFFGEKETEVSDEDMGVFFQGSTYGNPENRKEREFHSMGFNNKLELLLYKTFLPYEKMCLKYPKLVKRPLLYPYYCVCRWIKLLTSKELRNAVRLVLKVKASDEKKAEFKQMYSRYGLD